VHSAEVAGVVDGPLAQRVRQHPGDLFHGRRDRLRFRRALDPIVKRAIHDRECKIGEQQLPAGL